MKNVIAIISIALLLMVVGLSGCQEKSNGNGNQTQNGDHQQPPENNFIGDWEIISSSSDYEIWSYYENGSTKNTLNQDYEGQIITTISWFNYTNDSTSVCLSTKNEPEGSPNYFSVCYSYVFSENATRLALSSNSVVIMDLVKML